MSDVKPMESIYSGRRSCFRSDDRAPVIESRSEILYATTHSIFEKVSENNARILQARARLSDLDSNSDLSACSGCSCCGGEAC